MSEMRADRREQERKDEKAFELTKKQLDTQLAEVTNAGFKGAMLPALQHLVETKHPNRLVGITLLAGCMDCYKREDNDTARVLLYMSGVVVDQTLTQNVIRFIMAAQQLHLPPSEPQGS